MKKMMLLTAMVLMMSVLAACSDSPSDGAKPETAKAEAPVKTKKLTLNLTVAEGTSIDQGARKWGELLKQYTSGRYEIEVFNSSSLSGGDLIKTIEMTQKGSIDLAMSPASLLSGIEPNLSALLLPWLWIRGEDAVDKTLVPGTPVSDKIQEMMENKDMHVFGFVELGWRDLTNSKRVVRTPDDMKGLKIRVISKIAQDTVNTLGGNATNVAYAELFTALQQGAVDGQQNPLSSSVIPDKLYEAQKYVTLWGCYYDPQMAFSSKKFYDSLSAEDKDAFTRSAAEAMAFIKADNRSRTAADIALVEKAGLTVTILTPEEKAVFRKAVQPVYDKWIPTFDQAFVNALIEANK